ncbi:MAG: preprotein translocase subunit SecE [Phycisphaerae bacterium]
MSTIEIYKKNQGRYTRVGTFIGVMLIGLVGAYILSRQLTGYDWAESSYVRFGIPVLLVAALAGLMFWMMNRAKSADFLIATESEMKKVAWSSKKEVIGSTKVVLVATFIMAVLLAVVDLLFILLFSQMGVRIGW